MRAIAFAMLLCAARLDAQADWLRRVATIDLAVPRVLAADVAPDGSKIVTVDEHRDVVVCAFDPWREVSRAVVAGKAAIDDVRFDREGAHLVVTMAAGEKEPAQVFAVADGARVEGQMPALPGLDSTPPPGLAAALVSRQESVRAAHDGRTAVFHFDANLGVWRGAALHWLTRYLTGIALTGDGTHLLVTRTTSVDVHPIAGGAIWSLPLAFGEGAATAPFGAGAGFVCVDCESIVVADAATRRETARIALGAFGQKWEGVRLAAASDDGKRIVVTATSLGAQEPTTHLLDLQHLTATALPLARCRAAFGERGLLLLDGRGVTCGVTLEATFRWVPTGGEPAAPWLPEMRYANGALLRDRAEVVHLAQVWRPKDVTWELRRCSAVDGRVLARVVVPGMPMNVARLGDYLLLDDPGLVLRRSDDLAVVATAPVPAMSSEGPCVAAFAPRLAMAERNSDGVAVFDVVLPPDRAADNGTGRK